jgi:arginyl-tRNA synthetase
MQSLTTALSSLGLSDVESPPRNNVNDVCRAHLTRLIADITCALPAIVGLAIQCSQSLDKGDFVLATPALRLKGIDPGALALKLQQVWYRYRYVVPASRRDADHHLPLPGV